jgi:cyclophilin family peptidyl-prolyl cis-trans isomerase
LNPLLTLSNPFLLSSFSVTSPLSNPSHIPPTTKEKNRFDFFGIKERINEKLNYILKYRYNPSSVQNLSQYAVKANTDENIFDNLFDLVFTFSPKFLDFSQKDPSLQNNSELSASSNSPTTNIPSTIALPNMHNSASSQSFFHSANYETIAQSHSRFSQFINIMLVFYRFKKNKDINNSGESDAHKKLYHSLNSLSNTSVSPLIVNSLFSILVPILQQTSLIPFNHLSFLTKQSLFSLPKILYFFGLSSVWTSVFHSRSHGSLAHSYLNSGILQKGCHTFFEVDLDSSENNEDNTKTKFTNSFGIVRISHQQKSKSFNDFFRLNIQKINKLNDFISNHFFEDFAENTTEFYFF